MSALVDELRQKAKGQRNSVGDLWGDWICDKAADELTTLQSRLEAVEAERDHWREYSSGQGKLIESGVFVKNEEYIDLYQRAKAAEARVEELQKALEPLAKYEMNCIEFRDGRITIPEEWLNRARRALSQTDPSKGGEE